MIHFQHIFHRRYKGRTPLWRDFPVFPEIRFIFVFFSTRCTVMWETVGAKSSSTALSASNRTVHRRYPGGASEQARAINRASKAPSKMTSRGGFSLGLRTSAASNPSSTKRFFTCSTVRLVIPRAAATSATFHPGPFSPASHSNNARAWMNFLAAVLPFRVKASSSVRSSSVSVIRYRGDMTASWWMIPPLYTLRDNNELLNVTWY